MSDQATVFGASYSVYVRIVRLTLEEKGVPYKLEDVDIFGADRDDPAAMKRNPFRKIPTFEHAGFSLYETGAIIRYVDEVFSGRALQPADPKRCARMNQVIGIVDSYLYRSLVWGVYMHKPEDDDAALASALTDSRLAMGALSSIMGAGRFLNGGDTLSLADLHAYPVFRYGVMKPEGQAVLDEFPSLMEWFERMRSRASVKATLYPKEPA